MKGNLDSKNVLLLIIHYPLQMIKRQEWSEELTHMYSNNNYNRVVSFTSESWCRDHSTSPFGAVSISTISFFSSSTGPSSEKARFSWPCFPLARTLVCGWTSPRPVEEQWQFLMNKRRDMAVSKLYKNADSYLVISRLFRLLLQLFWKQIGLKKFPYVLDAWMIIIIKRYKGTKQT